MWQCIRMFCQSQMPHKKLKFLSLMENGPVFIEEFQICSSLIKGRNFWNVQETKAEGRIIFLGLNALSFMAVLHSIVIQQETQWLGSYGVCIYGWSFFLSFPISPAAPWVYQNTDAGVSRIHKMPHSPGGYSEEGEPGNIALPFFFHQWKFN